MDGISAAASGIAVGSVVVQLVDSIKKLHDFWCSVKDAPDDIRAIAAGLKVLLSVLDEIFRETKQPTPSMEVILLECITTAKEFLDMVERLEQGFKSIKSHVRKWNAMKTVFKNDQLKKSLQLLESMKSTLAMAQQMHYGILHTHQFAIQQRHQFELQRRHEFEIQQLELEMTAREISQLSLENSRTTKTFSKQPRSRQDKIMALKSELSQMAKAVSNPVHRSLCEMAVNKALQQIDDKLGVEPFTEASDFTDSNPEETNPKDSDFVSKKSYSRQPDWKIKIVTRKEMKTENVFCTIYVTTKTTVFKSHYNDHPNQYENEISITIFPAWWLIKLGISYAPRGSLFRSTTSGWKYQFNPYRLVSSDALIFEFCQSNNLAGVQTLLSRGEASVKDMDSLGRTPLHFAAKSHCVEICKLLICEGADKEIRDFNFDNSYNSGSSPLDLAAKASTNGAWIKPADCIDTFRLFQDNMNFSYKDGDGWRFLTHLFEARYIETWRIRTGIHADDNERNALVLCAFQIAAPHIKNYFVEIAAALILPWVDRIEWRDIFDFVIKMFDNGVDVKWRPDGYSILLRKLWWDWKRQKLCDDLHMILTKGADPHMIGLNDKYSPQKETPTSLALYNSWAFVNWRYTLLQISTDLEIFVEKELQQCPLRNAGWDEKSLLSLFQRHIHSVVIPKLDSSCDRCGHFNGLAELSWCRWLDCMKQDHNNSGVIYSNSEVDRSLSHISSDKQSNTDVLQEEKRNQETDDGGPQIDIESESEDEYSDAHTEIGTDCSDADCETDDGDVDINVGADHEGSDIDIKSKDKRLEADIEMNSGYSNDDSETKDGNANVMKYNVPDVDLKKEFRWVCIPCYYILKNAS